MTPARILIVENEGIIALDLERMLEHLGYHVVGIESSGEQALRQVQALEPDLVLLNIRLRGKLDGIQTAQAIRAERAIPIVFVTASTDNETRRRALQTRPGGFISKPVDEYELSRVLSQALARQVDDTN